VLPKAGTRHDVSYDGAWTLLDEEKFFRLGASVKSLCRGKRPIPKLRQHLDDVAPGGEPREGVGLLAMVRENVGQAGQLLFLPNAHLGGMDAE
jgi:hypothetical protein